MAIRVFYAALLLLVLSPQIAVAQSQADPEAAAQTTGKQTVRADHFMIAAAHPLASRAGYAMLRDGGSAVDAAIAALLVLNVVEPQSSGLGGGGFALTWEAEDQALISWDGRETAPLRAEPTMFLTPEGQPQKFFDAVAGGRSTGVPGLPALLLALHQAQGRLAWHDLFAPAIHLAQGGFPVSARLASLLDRYREALLQSPGAQRLFFHADGAPYRQGEILRNPELAKTLEALATGVDFYSHPFSTALAAAAGPDLTPQDFANYRVKQRPAVCIMALNHEICGMGPPSSGGVTVGQILGMMTHFPTHAWGAPALWSAYAQASALAYADRAAYLADADFTPVPVKGLLAPHYLTLRAQHIDPSQPAPKARPGNPPWRQGPMPPLDASQEKPGTTHVSVVDAEGNAVSLTASIETAFGSRRVAMGMLLNNQLTDFSFLPEKNNRPVANAAAPGKRPRSSMAPTLVFRHTDAGRALAVVTGSPGGSRIIGYVARSLLAHLALGQDPQTVVGAPHLTDHNTGRIDIEDRPDADALAAALTALGYAVKRRPMTSGLHMIAVAPDGALSGGADPRREGVVLGD